MPKPYTKETKEAYLRAHMDIYEGLGYNADEITEIINKQVAAEDISDERYDEFVERRNMIDATYEKLLDEKYTYFKGTEVHSNFTRIFRAMLRPETSVENVQYNEMLAMKSRSKKGCMEILQDAVALLSRITPDIIEAAKKDEDVFLQNYNAIMLGFVADNIREIMEKNTDYEGIPEAFPEYIIQFVRDNKVYYEDLNYFKCEAQMYANKYHLIIPEDADPIKITICYAQSNREDKQLISDLISIRDSVKKKNEEYKPANQDCIDYFKRIEKRMEEERKDYVAAGKKADKAVNKTAIIPFAKGICETAFRGSKPNLKLVNKRTKAVVDRAKTNFMMPFHDAAAEMEKILESGSIMRHVNTNYQDMLDSIKAIRKLSNKGNIRELAKEDRERLSEELRKLDHAAEEYLDKKYREEDKYSSRALKRIDAARFASAFVRGRMVEVVVAQNKELKDSLRYLTKEDVSVKLTAFRDEYKKNKSVKAFAKEQAYHSLAAEVLNQGRMTREKADKHVADVVKAIMKIYNNSEDFQKAVATGNSDTAAVALQKAAREMKQNEKVAVQDAQKDAEKQAEGGQAAQGVQKNAEKGKLAGGAQVDGGQKEAIVKEGVQNLAM